MIDLRDGPQYLTQFPREWKSQISEYTISSNNAGEPMQLIGMLDSPYVRRVAISLQLLGLRFEHRSISVFSTFEQFRKINPVVKAPSFICDDGEVLMDSTLIIEYAEALAAGRRSLMPSALGERQHTLREIGLALAACEKSIQIVYERNLRPAEKLHEPWIVRVTGQLLAAFQLLETDLIARPLAVTSAAINQAGVSVAVAWQFTQQMLPEVISGANYPALREFSAEAEALPEFIAAPHGAVTYHHSG
jgi:glutathione S-transferase